MVGCNLLEHPNIQQFDILSPPRKQLDLLNYASVEEYLSCHKPDIIIHAAGKVGGIQANLNHAAEFLSENLLMGLNLLLAAKKANIRKVLNLGSSCMYPRNATNPLMEDMILKGELEPTNEGYALAKIVVARMCQYITNEDKNFHYKTLIPCNIYGRWDNFDPTSSHMIPAVIRKIHEAIKGNKDAVQIWGGGTARREFMYAGDLADCIVHAITNFDTLPQVMNIGLGYDYTIDEYYKIIASALGYHGKLVHDLSKPVGMTQKLVDIGKLRKWGWKAETSLEIGIAKTYEFYLWQRRENDRVSSCK